MTPQVEKAVMGLIMAFDTARRAFLLQAQPGWDKASEELREALNVARDLGDVGSLPCQLGWWVSAQAQARTWLESSEPRRRGLTPAVMGTMAALQAYASGTLAIDEHGVRSGGRG